MLCSISGESPQTPVVSTKSGNVFEKRLVESYISENGKDPVSGEEMTVEDLIDVKTSHVVRPRPPTLTSIPSLLSVFQNEWDALALESYNIRQELVQTRQELSTALYQHDAAIRVIARLTRERDEARDALSKVTIGTGATINGDRMQIDSIELPFELSEKVNVTQEQLSKSRRKRPIPQDWASSDTLESFTVIVTSDTLFAGCSSLSVDAAGDIAIIGGTDGVAGVYSISKQKLVQTLSVGGGAITDSLWYGSRPVISTAAGDVTVFEDGSKIATFKSHAGAVKSLAMHPSGEILASVGVDKSFVFYDLPGARAVTQVYSDSQLTTAAFHPDGHLFASGGEDGLIRMYHTKSGEFAAQFECGGPVQALSFSENGIWFSAAAKNSSSVIVFDLRKEGKAAEVKTIETGSRVVSIAWDYTGQFLATAGPSGITIQQYTKSSKAWSEPLRSAVPAIALAWGSHAHSLISANVDGIISVLGTK